MAKSKKSTKKQGSSKAEKTEKVEKKVEKSEEKTEKVSEKKTSASEKKEKGFFGKLFERKFDASENILTIFKNKKIYAALIGEVLGTMILCMVLLTLGVYQPLYILFVLVAIMVAVYAFSGANLNPIVTVGMMVTRRMSAIRGVLYLLAQLVGAWLGQLVIVAFLNGSGSETEMPAMAEVADGMFWAVTMLEFVGAIIIAFFFARALQYKRSVFTFAAVAAGGVMIAFVVVYLLSYNYFELTNNFILNPAIAFMHQILPNEAEGFGQLMGKVMLALLTYVIFPVIGGAIGFLISDAGSVLNEENVKQ